MSPKKSFPIVFTDLDGTLLDHANYTFDDALPALESLQKSRVPVIFNTSKTQSESIALAKRMGLCHPLIVENGGAIVVPANYDFITQQHPTDGWNVEGQVIVLGASIAQIQSVLREAHDALALSGAYQSFSDMTLEELCALTNLDYNAASQAKSRYFSEPIIWHGNDSLLQSFAGYLVEHDLKIIRGGRFHHIIGETDKCTAMVQLSQMYEDSAQTPPRIIKIALGDSQNDQQMLNGADIAVVVKNKSGSGINISHANVIRTNNEGPAGWREGIENAFSSLAHF